MAYKTERRFEIISLRLLASLASRRFIFFVASRAGTTGKNTEAYF
jgi:hypothetical protein